MPKEKSSLTDPNPPKETPFYYARVPTTLLKKVERERIKRSHNKGAAVKIMMELYLRFPIPPEIDTILGKG